MIEGSAAGWSRRFARFVEKKTGEAIAAALPPYVTEFLSPAAGSVAIGNAWTTTLFDGEFLIPDAVPGRPACSLVFVQSADGNTGAPNPDSLGGGRTDKHLIYEGLSRVACNAVLSGAGTVRGGQLVLSVWHPELIRLRAELGLPRHPMQIVATAVGLRLDDLLLFNVPEIPVVLLAVESAVRSMEDALRARPWITVVAMASPQDLPRAFERLRAMGIERISCIGGRTLARALLDASLVDAVYLTTAPRPGGEPNTPLHVRPWRGPVLLRKRGTAVEEGVIFEHVVPRSV